MTEDRYNNPLVRKPIYQLLIKYAVPSILAFLVSALYNIVDQIFIGNIVGHLGNAATTVSFPITTISTAIALLLGIGTASNYSIYKGRGDDERAERTVATGITGLLFFAGLELALVMTFINPLLKLFGASENIFQYAYDYTSITSMAIVFIVFSIALSHIIRADGSPKYAMMLNVVGAILNIVLDYIFMANLNMGIKGAAWATFIGQVVSFLLALYYIFFLKDNPIRKKDFKIHKEELAAILKLGSAACINQLAMVVVQIVMNNVMTHYGAMSKYGPDIPLAAVGIASKLYIVLIGFNIGLAQGGQPIIGYNYGAKIYRRVKDTYLTTIKISVIYSTIFFLLVEIWPQIFVNIFGKGNDLYMEFTIILLRITLIMTALNGLQPITANFYTSIGKARLGIFVSLTRQVLFYLPLIIVLPKFFGILGALYATPIADFIAFVLAMYFVVREFKAMSKAGDEVILDAEIH
ncbi:MATE family efflux transporter [Fenollaria massiliensis]|uniref:MATE family efflux transporter n=1 Tax=Fenollaria massiliensis TaxID=938288 RepID=UPI00037B1ECE|nr:MATE family efflux transporter [Fenollaria massiliensis]